MKRDKNPKDFSASRNQEKQSFSGPGNSKRISSESRSDFLGQINPGAVIDAPGNMMEGHKGFSTHKPVTDFSKCIKCGKCWMNCPDMAYTQNKDGTFKVDLEKCKGCGICANECPVKCIKMEIIEQ